MSLQELQKKAGAALEAAQVIRDEFTGEEMPKEKATEMKAHMDKFDELKRGIMEERRLMDGQEFMTKGQGSPASDAQAQHKFTEAGHQADYPYDPKAWRETEVSIKTPYFPERKQIIRYHVPYAVAKDEKHEKAYTAAFAAYASVSGRVDQMAMRYPNDYKTLSEGIDTEGGFMAPAQLNAELIKKMATMSTFRQNARIMQTTQQIVEWVRINYRSAADDTLGSKFTSPIRLTWSGEQPPTDTSVQVTDQTYGLWRIPVYTAMASQPITRNILEDNAFDLMGQTGELFGEAFGLGENDAYWNGTGVAQPQGLLTNVDETDHIASVVSGSAAALTADGLIDLNFRLPAQYEQGARWYWAKQTEKAIRKLKDTTNQYLWPIREQIGNLGPQGPELLGSPWTRDEFLPAIAAGAFPIVYGNLNGYMVVERVGFSIEFLREVEARKNLVIALGRMRVGGRVIEPWKLFAQKVSA